MTNFKLLTIVALLGAMTINASESNSYSDGTQYCGNTPKALTPSPKQEDKEAKSAPTTPRPTK